MRLELECRGVKLLACDASWIDEALKADKPESELLVDLRKVTEFAPEQLASLKEKGIARVPIPLTAQSWSEQDMDAVRREFLRGKSPVVLLSKGGSRAALMALQHVARVERWSAEEALGRCPEVAQDDALKGLLVSYLERHQRQL